MESEQDIKAPIIERQMRRWNAMHHAKHPRGSPHRFLTISREEGTLSGEIAQALSQKLGWRLYDKEIVNQIARDSHVREEMVRKLDEKSYLMHDTILDSVLQMLKLPQDTPFDAKNYHESLLRTLVTIAARGDSILMGRGANFVLRWSAYGFHIRLTGSLELRVQRMSDAWKVAPEIARRRLLQIDEERRAFVRQHFQADAEDVRFYSIVFNVDQLSPQQIVSTTLALLNPEPARAESGLSAL